MASLFSIEHAASPASQRLARRRRLGLDRELHVGQVGRFLLIVAAYYGAAHLGYALKFAGPVAAVIWLPAGVGIALLYMFGPQYWAGVVVGDLLVNNYHALPFGTTVAQTSGNLLEVVIAAVLLRRFASRGPLLGSVAGIARLLGALAAGTFLSATIGSASLYFGDVVRSGSLPHLWRTWWLGDLVGSLIVVPLVIAWVPLPKRGWLGDRTLEACLLLAALVSLGTISAVAGGPLDGLVVPALIWAAVRFGQRGATLAVAVGAAFTVWGTVHYLGAFHLGSIDRTLLDAQLYLTLSTLSMLALAALASERDALARSARESRARIVVAADEERRRIERNVHDGAQQRLVALSAHLTLAAMQARVKPAAAASLFESAQAELQVAIDELRELVHGMRPQALRQFGLSRAIELLAARSTTHIDLVELPDVRLDETAEATAYYVLVEAITNAERYAYASVVQVSMRVDSGNLRIEIADDGIGGAVIQDDLGLRGLQDRIAATGGTFAVESEPGSGTRISAEIPPATLR